MIKNKILYVYLANRLDEFRSGIYFKENDENKRSYGSCGDIKIDNNKQSLLKKIVFNNKKIIVEYDRDVIDPFSKNDKHIRAWASNNITRKKYIIIKKNMDNILKYFLSNYKKIKFVITLKKPHFKNILLRRIVIDQGKDLYLDFDGFYKLLFLYSSSCEFIWEFETSLSISECDDVLIMKYKISISKYNTRLLTNLVKKTYKLYGDKYFHVC